jgi:predicted GNAT family acetyltransferase
MPVAVAHAPERSEFVALDETGQVGVLVYSLAEGVIDLQHTVVQPAAGGRGIGSDLVVAALEFARAEGLGVIPTCPFVPAVIARHPDYADLVRPTPR